MNSRLLMASAAVILAASATSAFAQGQFDRSRNSSVRDRPRPDYEALGIGTGGIRILPQATVNVAYDDNIYASETGEISDVITTVTGEANLFSDWNVHQITALARIRQDLYSDNSDENATTYNLGVSGRLDATRDIALTGGINYDNLIEPRSASGNPTAAVRPIEFQVAGADLGGFVTFNKLRVRGNVSRRDYDYDDGRTIANTIIDQSFRNQKATRGTLRADYAISPDTALFVEGVLDKRDYDRSSTTSLVVRDSNGAEFNVGADFDITDLIRGSVQVGYLEQDYKDPSITDTSSVGGRVAVEYFPTQLATVTFRAERTVRDTGLITTSGYLSSDYSVQIDYELLRNVILTARVNAGNDDYEGLFRKDTRFGTTLSGVWLLNRRWGVGANYNYTKQDSEGLGRGRDFEAHRISASLTLQY